jgi:predicted PurR-regulated permease PerM
MLLLSAFFMVGMGVIGLNYGLVIGLAAGLLSFIPYVGAFVGFVVSGAVAAAQFWPDWAPIAAVLGVFLVGQAIEGNILTPKIVGDNVHLHPVWLIFALLAFGYAFGFAGLLIAVPAAAVCGVLVRRALRTYFRSEAYLSQDGI